MKLRSRGVTLLSFILCLLFYGLIITISLSFERKPASAAPIELKQVVEEALAKAPAGSCYVGVDRAARPSEIAESLNKHPEFELVTALPQPGTGTEHQTIFKRKNCGGQ